MQAAKMDIALIDKICGGFAGAVRAEPVDGEIESWKVGGKMFACFAASRDGITVKTASVEAAAFLIEIGIGLKAPYFHRSWVLLPFTLKDEEEVAHRLQTSYELIVGKLTKAARAAL